MIVKFIQLVSSIDYALVLNGKKYQVCSIVVYEEGSKHDYSSWTSGFNAFLD